MKAQCQCGQLAAELPGPTLAVVACHCIYCQRRGGSPFGVLAYYPANAVKVSGESKRFERPTHTGGIFESFFCPECGSTVYVKTAKHPTMLSVAVGAVGDPKYQRPVRSVWEKTMHDWVCIPGEVEHFSQGRQE